MIVSGIRLVRGAVAAMMLLWSSGTPVAAQTKVTFTLTADGDVAARIVAVSLPPEQVGYVRMIVSDERGLGEGWDIVLSLDTPDAVIDLLSPHRIVVLAGQPVIAQGPDRGVVVEDRPLGRSQITGIAPPDRLGDGTSVLRAAPGAGSGMYRLNLTARAHPLPPDTNVVLTVGMAP